MLKDHQIYNSSPMTGNSTGNSSVCVAEGSSLSNYLYVFLMGQGFHGLAGTALYAIGPAYIDGSVSSKQSPTYLGKSRSSQLMHCLF